MAPVNLEALSRKPTMLVNRSFTMKFRQGWSARRSSAMGGRMATRKPMAGGFFWMAGILIGAVWGVVAGNPMKGILIGTGAGAAIAAVIWLLDRSRR
jgi:hypothetical protein